MSRIVTVESIMMMHILYTVFVSIQSNIVSVDHDYYDDDSICPFSVLTATNGYNLNFHKLSARAKANMYTYIYMINFYI